jgi:hypothetical protein
MVRIIYHIYVGILFNHLKKDLEMKRSIADLAAAYELEYEGFEWDDAAFENPNNFYSETEGMNEKILALDADKVSARQIVKIAEREYIGDDGMMDIGHLLDYGMNRGLIKVRKNPVREVFAIFQARKEAELARPKSAEEEAAAERRRKAASAVIAARQSGNADALADAEYAAAKMDEERIANLPSNRKMQAEFQANFAIYKASLVK